MHSIQPSKTAEDAKKERAWSPRMWLGCDLASWLRIVNKAGWRIPVPYWQMAGCIGAATIGHSVLKTVQHAIYGRQVARTRIEHAPIFIIGHWRTGTTLLHELMILDERHSYPNTYQCLSPNDFLITEKYFKKWFWFLLPNRRPMDNMDVGWERPQEDEFAMCMLGQPSPYLDIIFPNQSSVTPGALDLEGLTPRERNEWKKTFYQFVQALTFKDSRRLVLKSPPHSCRIPTLLELFPDARFVHIVRNPYDVYPSTVKLWKSLADKHGLQTPHNRGLEEKVLSTLPHLYAKLEEGKKLIAPSRFHEVRYEDLVADPLGQMEILYKQLEMSGYGELRPRLEDYLAHHASYETNKFKLSPEQRRVVTERWGEVIRHYGYSLQYGEESQALNDRRDQPSSTIEDVPSIFRFPTPEPLVENETALPSPATPIAEREDEPSKPSKRTRVA